MNRTANEEAVKKCMEYIKDSPDYTFEKFLKEHGAWNGAEDNGRQIKILCPFHKERTPSRYINEQEKITNCFSCNKGGGYVKFVTMFYQEVLKSNTNFYQVLNNILAADPKMQLKVGFSSIYRTEVKKDLSEIASFKRKKFSPQMEEIITTYLQLAATMQRDNMDSIQTIRLAILYAQDGYAPESIYKLLKNDTATAAHTESKFEGVDLADILGEIDLDL